MSDLKITILGCGSSFGVPLFHNIWGKCDPKEPKNRRTRPSILVQKNSKNLLIDTSPDLKQQFLNLPHLAVIISLRKSHPKKF